MMESNSAALTGAAPDKNKLIIMSDNVGDKESLPLASLTNDNIETSNKAPSHYSSEMQQISQMMPSTSSNPLVEITTGDDETEEDLFGTIGSAGPSKHSTATIGSLAVVTNNDQSKNLSSTTTSLLSSSGLLPSSTPHDTNDSTASDLMGGSLGSGLFDEVDAAEREADEALVIERKRIEEMEKLVTQERERRLKEQHLRTLAEEQERIEYTRRRNAEILHEQEEMQRQNEMRLQAQMQQMQLQNHQQQQVVQNGKQGANINEGMDFNVGGNLSSNEMGISSVTPHNQSQNSYSNTLQYSNVNEAHSQQIVSGNNLQSQPQGQQQQVTNTKGFGGASYFYSTSGNAQQVLQDPNIPTSSNIQVNKSNTSNANTNNLSYASNGNIATSSIGSTSYTQRSQLLQNNQNLVEQQKTQPGNMGQVILPSSPGMHRLLDSHMSSNQNNLATSNSPVTANLASSSINYVHHDGMARNFPILSPNSSAGIGTYTQNNYNQTLLPQTTPRTIYDLGSFSPIFGEILVTDPILVQSPGLFSGPPHWSYCITVKSTQKIEGQKEFSKVVSSVRRRFRHFVAMEDRLRGECPGAILPPRPDKHPTRALEEATSRQSAQFALQRAAELESYLNALRFHPLSGKSKVLAMFLTLPDHIGTAWPEVSSSIFTRISEVGSSTAIKVAEGTNSVINEFNSDYQAAAGEESADILALTQTEGLRIGNLLQAVPKIEGTVSVIREQGEKIGIIGLECQKLAKHVLASERDLSVPFEILSIGLMRTGRRTTRLATELGAASVPFIEQHKLCKYERLAFSDRRAALSKRRDTRKEADLKAQKLVMNRNSLQSMGKISALERMEMEASIADEFAAESVQHAEDIGRILQLEVARISESRNRDWKASMRVIAANMKEACSERVAIWDSCKNELDKAFNTSSNIIPNSEIVDTGSIRSGEKVEFGEANNSSVNSSAPIMTRV